jgi:hypothetical protein
MKKNWIAVASAAHARRGRDAPGGGFVPYRRGVAFAPGREAPLQPLLDDFDFVQDRQHRGYKFRFGLVEVSDHDMRMIADAMEVPRVLLHLQ